MGPGYQQNYYNKFHLLAGTNDKLHLLTQAIHIFKRATKLKWHPKY